MLDRFVCIEVHPARLHSVACLSGGRLHGDVALRPVQRDGGEDHKLLPVHLHHVHRRVGVATEQLCLDVLYTIHLLDLDQQADIHIGLGSDRNH